MKQFILTHKKPVLIAAIFTLIIAALCFIYAAYVVNAAEPTPVSVLSEPTSSAVDSSAPTSSAPVVVVPKIEPPVSSAAPSSEQPSSSKASSATPSAPKVNIEANVSDKEETPIEKPASKPAEKAPEKQKTPPEGDLMPQPNPEFAKTPNRNMPSFTVDTSITGASGARHGDTKTCDIIGCTTGCSGTITYHAGIDTWFEDEYFYVYRYGEHPEATTYLNHAPQISPYQQDGDYNPFRHRGDYYCKACNGWIDSTAWENGKHGSGRNHIANTKKMAG